MFLNVDYLVKLKLTLSSAIMAPGVYNLAAISLISKLTGTDFYPDWAGEAFGATFYFPPPLTFYAEELEAARDYLSSLYLACAIFCSLRRILSFALSSDIFFSISVFYSYDS